MSGEQANAGSVDHPVHDLIAKRWSPYSFLDRDIAEGDLRALFEAARWAPSSYNEQPWRFIVATRANRNEFDRMLSCLVPANQKWASAVPVLILTVASKVFERNGNENAHAHHDLGLAVGNMVAEATARGIGVHQMAGIDPVKAREVYRVPEGCDVVTAIALGYTGEAPPEARSRRPLSEQVFAGTFGEPAPLLPGGSGG